MSPSYVFRRYGIPVLMVLAAVLVFRQLAGHKKEQKRGAPRAFVRKVVTQTAVFGTVRPEISGAGRVLAWETVSLTPEVTGIILADGFRLRKGASFAAGEVLFSLDSRQAANTLHVAVSDLQNALTGLLPELKTDMPDAFERWNDFFTALSPVDLPEIPAYDTEREKLLVNRFGVFKLYYTVKNLRLALAKHTVRAPFTGTVARSMVHAADMARAGSPVAELSRTDVMEIELALPVNDAAMVRAGMPASAVVDNGDPVRGTVHRVSNVLDGQMQTVPVFMRIAGSPRHGLVAGAYAVVTLRGRALERAMAVPRKALHGSDRVYIIEAGRLAERQVTVAYRGETMAVITGGVDEGAILVAEPLQDAVIGMEVRSAADPDPEARPERGPQAGAEK